MSDRPWLLHITPLVVARREYALARAMRDPVGTAYAWDHVLQALPWAQMAAERFRERVQWWIEQDAGGPVWFGTIRTQRHQAVPSGADRRNEGMKE